VPAGDVDTTRGGVLLGLALAVAAGCTANPPTVWSYRDAVAADPSLAKFIIPAPQWWKMQREEKLRTDEDLPAPGQDLEIRVWGQEKFPERMQIRSDGRIDFPLVGPVQVAGRPLEEVKATLVAGLQRAGIREPKVALNTVRQRRLLVQEIQAGDIAVLGEVRTPQIVSFFGDQTVFQALAVAGHLTPDAEWDEVAVIRRRKTRAGEGAEAPLRDLERGFVILVDAEAFLRYGDWRQNIPLEPGDIVFAPKKRTLGRRIEEDFDLVMKYVRGGLDASSFVLQIDRISRISNFGRP
jgi:polysaccharide export outer membrane protein